MDRTRFARLKRLSLFGGGLTLFAGISGPASAGDVFVIVGMAVVGVIAMLVPIWVVLGRLYRDSDKGPGVR